MPRTMPAIIDSHGNPGIGGNANGVETELDCEVLAAAVVVCELVTVKVATGVLDAIVETLVELEVETLVTTEVLVELAVLVVVGVVEVDGVVYVVPPPPVGG